jgi:hypothetical protein
LNDALQSAARLQMSAKKPALALESIEDQIDSIECTVGEAQLSFATLEALQSVYMHFENVPEFFLITSHDGCNVEGERGIFL